MLDINSTFEHEREDIICVTLTAAQVDLIKIWRYWLGGVLLLFLSVLGLFTNSLSIFILTRKILAYKTFNQLLTAMAGFDFIYLLLMSYESFGQIYIKDKNNSETLDWYYIKAVLYPYFLHPVKSISMTGSIYVMIAVAIERHIAVNKPFSRIPETVEQFRSGKRRKKIRYRFLVYLVPVLILSIILNITKFLESRFNSKLDLFIEPTPLRMNQTYLVVYASIRLVSLGCVPLTLVSVLNYKIYKRVRQSSSNRRIDEALLLVLTSIVVIFFLCNIPHFIILLYEVKIMATIKRCSSLDRLIPFWNHILGFVSHSLLVLNPFLNFLVYCVVGKTFRRVASTYISRLLPCFSGLLSTSSAVNANSRFTWSLLGPRDGRNQSLFKNIKNSQEKLEVIGGVINGNDDLHIVHEEQHQHMIFRDDKESDLKHEDFFNSKSSVCNKSSDIILHKKIHLFKPKLSMDFELPVLPSNVKMIKNVENGNYTQESRLILHKRDNCSVEVLI